MAKKSVSLKKTETKSVKKLQPPIVKVAESILDKLVNAKIDTQLQADAKWCLGSYAHDQNPIGLYQVAERALGIFKAEHAKKTKGFTAKAIADIEKALKEK